MRHLLFILFFSAAISAAFAQQGGNWKFINIPGTTYMQCWSGLEVSGDSMYTLRASKDHLLLMYSYDHGKEWKSEVIDDLRSYGPGGVKHEVEIESITGKSKGKKTKATIDNSRAFLSHFNVGFTMDAAGNLHVCYTVSHGQKSWLKYGIKRKGGKWQVSVVDSRDAISLTGHIGLESELAIDSKGGVHIAYINDTRLNYAYSAGGNNWSIQVIPVKRPAEHDPLKNDDALKVHVAVDEMVPFGSSISGVGIALDSKDGVHICVTRIRDHMWYCYSGNNGKTWDIEQLESGSGSILWFECDIISDNNDRPHVAIRNLHSSTIHGVKEGGKWKFTQAASNGCRGKLFADADDRIHMTTYPNYHTLGHDNAVIDYSVSADNGNTWSKEELRTNTLNTCSSSYADIAFSGKRLYVNYFNNDTCLSIAWKELDLKKRKDKEKLQVKDSVPGAPVTLIPADTLAVTPPRDTAAPSISTSPAMRNVSISKVIHSAAEEVELHIYDHEKQDGDRVTIVFNDRVILRNHLLTNEKHVIKLKLLKGSSNLLVVHALNMGTVPPNTSTITITGPKDEQQITLESDMQQSAAIRFIYDEK